MLMETKTTLTKELIYDNLKKVIDPELNIDIVSLGLVYDVTISPKQTPEGEKKHIHVLLTLTTPGCPLSGVFEQKIKETLDAIPGLDAYTNVTIELTFDPPWIPDMMTPEARAELGF